jgi:hypothetical protein
MRDVVAAQHAVGHTPHWRDVAVLYVVRGRRARPYDTAMDVAAAPAVLKLATPVLPAIPVAPVPPKPADPFGNLGHLSFMNPVFDRDL